MPIKKRLILKEKSRDFNFGSFPRGGRFSIRIYTYSIVAGGFGVTSK